MNTLEIMGMFSEGDWNLYRALLRTKTEDDALAEMAERIKDRNR